MVPGALSLKHCALHLPPTAQFLARQPCRFTVDLCDCHGNRCGIGTYMDMWDCLGNRCCPGTAMQAGQAGGGMLYRCCLAGTELRKLLVLCRSHCWSSGCRPTFLPSMVTSQVNLPHT